MAGAVGLANDVETDYCKSMSTPENAPLAPPAHEAPHAVAGPEAPYNVLSIVGFALSFFNSISGAVLGFIALSDIRKTGQRGRGFALAAVIISFALLAVRIIVILVLAIFFIALIAHSNGQTSVSELYNS